MIEQPSAEKDVHQISTHATAFGWGWGCSCGAQGKGNSAPSAPAAYAHGSRHVVSARRKARDTSPGG